MMLRRLATLDVKCRRVVGSIDEYAIALRAAWSRWVDISAALTMGKQAATQRQRTVPITPGIDNKWSVIDKSQVVGMASFLPCV